MLDSFEFLLVVLLDVSVCRCIDCVGTEHHLSVSIGSHAAAGIHCAVNHLKTRKSRYISLRLTKKIT